jgi:hypothetical protein
MAAAFPTSVKTFTTRSDNTDTIFAAHINDLQDEVNAIETALGVSPTNSAFRSTNYGSVDARLEGIETDYSLGSHTHSGYMATSGGTFSGNVNHADFELQRPLLVDWAEKLNTVATSTAALALDYAVANVWDVTLSVGCTFSFSNFPASGRAGTLTLILRNGASAFAATWPAAVKWAGGTAPTLSGINKADIITFVTLNGGTSIAATLVQDFASL